MAQITYTNKEALNENPEIANINKVTDDDMNEIKQVVNDNYNYTIQITTTEPTDDDGKLWINPDDVLVRQDNIVKTTYNESDDNTYSTNYINNAFGGKILWTNSNPTTAITTTTITLTSDDYDVLEIIYRMSIDSNIQFSSKFLKGAGCELMGGVYGGNNYEIMFRTLSRTNDTSFDLDKCFYGRNKVLYNDGIIPLYIIGYKSNLFN